MDSGLQSSLFETREDTEVHSRISRGQGGLCPKKAGVGSSIQTASVPRRLVFPGQTSSSFFSSLSRCLVLQGVLQMGRKDRGPDPFHDRAQWWGGKWFEWNTKLSRSGECENQPSAAGGVRG